MAQQQPIISKRETKPLTGVTPRRLLFQNKTEWHRSAVSSGAPSPDAPPEPRWSIPAPVLPGSEPCGGTAADALWQLPVAAIPPQLPADVWRQGNGRAAFPERNTCADAGGDRRGSRVPSRERIRVVPLPRNGVCTGSRGRDARMAADSAARCTARCTAGATAPPWEGDGE